VAVVFGYGTPEARYERPSWRYLSGPDIEAARRALVAELAACTAEMVHRQDATGGQP